MPKLSIVNTKYSKKVEQIFVVQIQFSASECFDKKFQLKKFSLEKKFFV